MIDLKNRERKFYKIIKVKTLPPYVRRFRENYAVSKEIPHLYFYKNVSNFQTNEGNILEWALELKQAHEKGEKNAIWIKPRPGYTLGRLSETILELAVLNRGDSALLSQIQKKKINRLIRTWHGADSNYYEPFPLYLNANQIPLKDAIDKLNIRYARPKIMDTQIDFWVPKILLAGKKTPQDDHIYTSNLIFRIVDRSGRLDVSYLVKNHLIDKLGNITSLTEDLIEALETSFIYEWWVAYFLTNRDNQLLDFELIKKFEKFDPQIRLRAYLEIVIYNNPLGYNIQISDLEKSLKIPTEIIKKLVESWNFDGYLGIDCINGSEFIFPPPCKKLWLNNAEMKKKFQFNIDFIGREKEHQVLKKFLEGNQRVLIIEGGSGVGKTRFLLEAGIRFPNFLWLIPGESFLLTSVTKELNEFKEAVLIIDDLPLRKNWENILPDYNQVEAQYPEKLFKLILVTWDPTETNIIQKHYFARTNNPIPILKINPFNFNIKDEIYNQFITILKDHGCSINIAEEIIKNSQGFLDSIDEALPYYLESTINQNVIFEQLSTFDQRMKLFWNDPELSNPSNLLKQVLLNREERVFLMEFSLTGEISIDKLKKEFEIKENLKLIIENLIKKDFLTLFGNHLIFKRSKVQFWILENIWYKKKENFIKLDTLLRNYILDFPLKFAISVNNLSRYFSFQYILNWINQITIWGIEKTNWEEEIIALNELMPILNPSYFKKILEEHAVPTVVNVFIQSCSNTFPFLMDIAVKLANIWKNFSFKEKLERIAVGELLLRVFISTGNIIEAERFVIGLIETYKQPKNPNFDFNLHRLILLKINLGSYSKSNTEYESELLEYLNKVCNQPIKEIEVLETLGDLNFYHFKNYEKSVELYFKIISIAEKNHLIEQYVDAIHRIVLCWYFWGRINVAIDEFFPKILLARQWAKEYNQLRQLAGLTINLSKLLPKTYFNPKIDEIKDIIEKVKESSDYYLVGDLYHFLGKVLLSNEQYNAAIESFELAIEYTKKSGVEKRIGMSYTELGRLYNMAGQFEKSISTYLMAKEANKKEGDIEGEIEAINYIIDILEVLGQWQEAEKYIEEAIRFSKNIPINVYTVEAYLRAAEIFLMCEKYLLSLKYLFKLKRKKLRKLLSPQNNIHSILIEILAYKHLDKYDLLKNSLNLYTSKFKEVDLKENGIEITWVFIAIDSFLKLNDEEMAKKMMTILISHPKISNDPFEEIASLVFDNVYKKSKTFFYEEYPSWAKFILENLPKPKNPLLDPVINLLFLEIQSSINNIEFQQALENLRLLIEKAEKSEKKEFLIIQMLQLIRFINNPTQISMLFNTIKEFENEILQLSNFNKKFQELYFFNLAFVSNIARNMDEFNISNSITDYGFYLAEKIQFYKPLNDFYEIRILSTINEGLEKEAFDWIQKAQNCSYLDPDLKRHLTMQKIVLMLKSNQSLEFEKETEFLSENNFKEKQIQLEFIKIMKKIKDNNWSYAELRLIWLIRSYKTDEELLPELLYFVINAVDFYLYKDEKIELNKLVKPQISGFILDVIEKNPKLIPRLIADYERVLIYYAIYESARIMNSQGFIDANNFLKRIKKIAILKNSKILKRFTNEKSLNFLIEHVFNSIDSLNPNDLLGLIQTEIETYFSNNEFVLGAILAGICLGLFIGKNISPNNLNKAIKIIEKTSEIIDKAIDSNFKDYYEMKELLGQYLDDENLIISVCKVLSCQFTILTLRFIDFITVIDEKQKDYPGKIYDLWLQIANAIEDINKIKIKFDKKLPSFLLIIEKILDYEQKNIELLWQDLIGLFPNLLSLQFTFIEFENLITIIENRLEMLSNLEGWQGNIGKLLKILWKDVSDNEYLEFKKISDYLLKDERISDNLKPALESLSKCLTKGRKRNKILMMNENYLLEKLKDVKKENKLPELKKVLIELVNITYLLEEHKESLEYCEEIIQNFKELVGLNDLREVYILKANNLVGIRDFTTAEIIYRSFISQTEKYGTKNFAEASLKLIQLHLDSQGAISKQEFEFIENHFSNAFLDKSENVNETSETYFFWFDLIKASISIQQLKVAENILCYLQIKIEALQKNKDNRVYEVQINLIAHQIYLYLIQKKFNKLIVEFDKLIKRSDWKTFWAVILRFPQLLKSLSDSDNNIAEINSQLIELLINYIEKDLPQSKFIGNYKDLEKLKDTPFSLESPMFFLHKIIQMRPDFFSITNKPINQ